MKFRSKIKNLFIVVMLCLLVAVPLFSSQINVKADTNSIPIFDIEPTLFYEYKVDLAREDLYLLIKKNIYEQLAENIQVCGTLEIGGYECFYINDIYDYLVNEEWIAPEEWWNYIDFSYYENLYDFPSIKHYKNKYYLIPISVYLSLDWGVNYILSNGVSLYLNEYDYESYRFSSYYSHFTIFNFYDKKIMPYYDIYNNVYDDAYSKGQLDGKAEAFENYDRLAPTVLGSIVMFFTSIFGSINFFGISLLSIIGIIGGIALILMVLKVVRG